MVGELAVAVMELGGEFAGGGAACRVLGEAARQERQQRVRYAGEVGLGVADAVEEVGGLARAEGAVARGGEDRTPASAKTSPAGVCSWPVACSGDMKAGVPAAAPVRVRRSSPAARAMPKSMIFGP